MYFMAIVFFFFSYIDSFYGFDNNFQFSTYILGFQYFVRYGTPYFAVSFDVWSLILGLTVYLVNKPFPVAGISEL